MPSNYYNQVVDAIRKQGFTRIRQGKGSHEIWARAGAGNKVSIPSKLRSRHTANRILKDAGCDERV
jgi:predicted RNA binding protein YcfA (HicA-like mRNA interferase family)